MTRGDRRRHGDRLLTAGAWLAVMLLLVLSCWCWLALDARWTR